MDSAVILLIIFIVAVIVIIVGVFVFDDTKPNQAIAQQNDVEGPTIDNGTTKETFFAIGGEGATINGQGTIIGNHIYTNGLLNQPWDEITDAVANKKPLKDKAVLGGAAGDAFEGAWSNHRQQTELSEGKEIGVKTPEEIAEIEKKLSGTQNNNNSCFYSRGGATKAKIVLDPLGCRGVTDSYDTPERDRNHKIYDGGSAVYVPGFDINMSNLPKELTINGKGWGKGFAGNTVHDFTSKEAKEQEQSAIQSIQEDVPMETFSAMN